MEGRRLVIVEANEVPRRVVEDVAATGRLPFLSSLLASDALIDTRSYEQLDRELYPAQSWASMNTGVPQSEHGVQWYGDPKPARYPMYWQYAATAGRSVGLVNTLHSSPLDQQCEGPGYRFVIPDCFGDDPATLPPRYRGFQQLNLDLTKANGRKAGKLPGPGALLGLARSLPRVGLRRSTVAELTSLVGGVAAGRIPQERLRSGQFLILRDLFVKLIETHQPDLAVFFTNHVAASMHRYWYAMYPGDFEQEHYDDTWVERYRDEIPQALGLLDEFLGRLHRWCAATDRTLVLSSSMGQGPSQMMDELEHREAVVSDPRRFLDAIGIDPSVRVAGSMVPQLTLDCGSDDSSDRVARRLSVVAGESGAEADEPGGDVKVRQRTWLVDRSGPVVTLTYSIEVAGADSVILAGGPRPAKEVGITVHEVDDHSSGRHIPLGILGVANSPSFHPAVDEYVDVMDYAPAVLQHLGVAPADHHRTPAFRL